MCGIAGIITVDRSLDLLGPLESMRNALRHRGPDDEGIDIVDTRNGQRIGLAHTRLSILDLSVAGHQPMIDPETGARIVYNGEIYNHIELRRRMELRNFRSQCDTETLLKAWGAEAEEVLPKLRGMFAFGVFDEGRDQFTLVRDRMGIKPLYFARSDDGTWIFSSEVRSLIASGLIERSIDPGGLELYLKFGAVPPPFTLVKGVSSLEPAEMVRFDFTERGRIRSPKSKLYWKPKYVKEEGGRKVQEDGINRIRNEFVEASRLRTLSDVPLGVFLSGGIDSSALVAALRSVDYDLNTFSIGFEESEFDESRFAKTIADHFGTAHTELKVSSQDALAAYDDALSSYDQPSIDGVNSYFISRCAREAGITVALSGLGSDEIFAGYPSFRYLKQINSPFGRAVAKVGYAGLRTFGSTAVKTRKLGSLLAQTGDRLRQYGTARAVYGDEAIGRMLGFENIKDLRQYPYFDRLGRETKDLDTINAHSRLELGIYLSSMLLKDTDQMSMAHGLEVRVPFVDHKLIEAVGQMPGDAKLSRRRPKPMLLDSLPVALPRSIVFRRKMGFVFPWADWLRNDLRDQVESVAQDRRIWDFAGISHQEIESVWNAFLSNESIVRDSDVLCFYHLGDWVRRHLMS